jgi:hypothetical protein
MLQCFNGFSQLGAELHYLMYSFVFIKKLFAIKTWAILFFCHLVIHWCYGFMLLFAHKLLLFHTDTDDDVNAMGQLTVFFFGCYNTDNHGWNKLNECLSIQGVCSWS